MKTHHIKKIKKKKNAQISRLYPEVNCLCKHNDFVPASRTNLEDMFSLSLKKAQSQTQPWHITGKYAEGGQGKKDKVRGHDSVHFASRCEAHNTSNSLGQGTWICSVSWSLKHLTMTDQRLKTATFHSRRAVVKQTTAHWLVNVRGAVKTEKPLLDAIHTLSHHTEQHR